MKRWKATIMIMALGLVLAGGAYAQLRVPAGFGIIGYIDEATLKAPLGDYTGLRGGTITVNGTRMIVPDNSIIQMPANMLTWPQMFDPAVSASIYDTAPGYTAPLTPWPNHPDNQTGLAFADNPLGAEGVSPWPSYEVALAGNVDPVSGEFIVGLITPAAQELLAVTSGKINHIDFATGRFRVGGIMGDPLSGTLVEINDPVGRWGWIHSPDPRFTTDTENPTVFAMSGYPLGVPRVAPVDGDPDFVGDVDRPYTNRPLNGITPGFERDPFLPLGAPQQHFTMPRPGALVPGTPVPYKTNPLKQAPLMVGDFVNVSGTKFKINPTDPNIPSNMYISAFAVEAQMGVYTAPGTVAGGAGPAYLIVEASLIGTGGTASRAGINGEPVPFEVKRNIVIVGAVTDHTQLVDIYAIDVVVGTVNEQLRLLGTVLPEAPAAANAVTGLVGRKQGRFTFIVDRGNFATWTNASSSAAPARITREYIAKTRHGQAPLGPQSNGLAGLNTGQYRWPMFDFLYPEARPGWPTVPNNFQDMKFLRRGSNIGATIVPPLTPFPPFQPQ